MHPLTHRLIERSPRRLRPAVELTAGTVDGAVANRLPGLAAEIAFWVVLSAPALVLTALATISLVAADGSGWQDEAIDRLVELATVALTPEAIDAVVRPVLDRLITSSSLSVVSVGFLASLWVASRAVKVVLVTVAITYGAESPGGVAHRVLGLLVTVLGLVIALVLAPLVLVGPGFGEQLAEQFDGVQGTVLAEAWRLAYWPVAATIATAAIASVYHLGAPWNTRWRRDLPGAVLATTVWLGGSAGLRLYGTWILDGESVYGPLAGPIVVLLWVWLTAFAVLLGAQWNASIEHRWPTRPTDGDTPPTGLKRLTTTSRLAAVGREDREDREDQEDRADQESPPVGRS